MSLDNNDSKRINLRLVTEIEEMLPTNPAARMAVLRSREIVKRNNEFISKIKEDSQIDDQNTVDFSESEFFSQEDSYTFDLYKIKSKSTLKEFIKDMFRI